MIIGILLLAALIVLYIKGRNYEKEALVKAGKKIKLPRSVGSAGLFLAELAAKLLGKNKAGKNIKRPKKKTEDSEEGNPLLLTQEERMNETANLYGTVLIVLFAGAAAASVLGFCAMRDRTVREIARPEFGTEKQVELIASHDGKEETLSVTVSGKLLEKGEISLFLDRVFEREKSTWLGRNPSDQEVRTRLSLTEESTEGVRFSFESADPEALSNRGSILEDTIPEQGITVVMRVTLSFRASVKSYDWELRLLPDTEKTAFSALEKALEDANAIDPESDSVTLPREVGGLPVTFLRSVTSPYPVLLLTIIASVLILVLRKEKRKNAMKKRSEALDLSYAAVVSKLSTLIGAGSSIREAWYRTVAEYRKARELGLMEHEYAYEEMARTANELRSGVAEPKAYIDYGIRCRNLRYRKLGNLLAENVRQGISGLEAKLREETESAMEERKNIALRKGEEAGTKLLMPMMLMLGIVIVTLVVPAFMAL